MSQQTDTDLESVFDHLMGIIRTARLPSFEIDEMEIHPKINQVYVDLIKIRGFIHALSTGNLSYKLHLKGFMGGCLQTLQAHLKHLTWQTQAISKGDFTQKVDFMGEFSEAFNSMVDNLKITIQTLKDKEIALSRANNELRNEIESRIAVEAQLRESEAKFRMLSITDPLTQLYNRRYFFETLKKELNRAERYHLPLAVLMLDVDHFKQINDSYGHASGDKVLQAISRFAQTVFRNSDTSARYGGEEFVFLLPETSVESAVVVANRFRKQIEETPIPVGNCHIRITVSIGVSGYPQTVSPNANSCQLADLLISKADNALYQAKASGRNCVVVGCSDDL